MPGPPTQLAPSKQQTTRPSVRVKSSFTNKTSTNNVIPDLGALVKTEADNKERNKRTSGRIQEDFDLNKIADGGRTRQTRRSIKGMYTNRKMRLVKTNDFSISLYKIILLLFYIISCCS